MIGRVLSGRYLIEEKVGSGGMAVVYRARDQIKKQTVAIKVLRPEYESDEEFVQRFSREAEAASKVSHENIVNMFDVGIDDGLRYIVMEYVDGKTLKDMIREEGRIEPDRALRMTIRILAAVDHAHRNGIVHRDIKPQNILVDKHERVKVADFGIARLKTSQTTTNIQAENGAAALGSVHYFSPEQARGEVADEKSDLYSVGVVMYEMLTGRVPFDGDTMVAIALKHINEEPKSMRLYAGNISRALDEVVMRALAKDPRQRYQTAAEMAADLRKTIRNPRGGFVRYPQDEQQQASEEETGESEHKKAKPRRRLSRFAGVLIAIVVGCALLAVTWFFVAVYGTVEMPNVLGMQAEAAKELLQSEGFTVQVEQDYSEEYDAGLICVQSHSAGTRVAEGIDILLWESIGSRWFYLDDFTGQTREEVEAAFADTDVDIQFEDVISEGIPVGSVVSQSAEKGFQSREDTYTFSISALALNVPDLTGLKAEGAVALLEAEGLQVGEITVDDTVDAADDTVISQSVAANTRVERGTVVDLTVSSAGDAYYTTTAPFTVAVPLDNMEVTITLRTRSGEEVTVYAGKLNKGTYPLTLSCTEPGNHEVNIYIQGVRMDTTVLYFE